MRAIAESARRVAAAGRRSVFLRGTPEAAVALLISIFIAVASLAASPARAGMEQAREAFVQGDHVLAFQEFIVEAVNGHTGAQVMVAQFYYLGLGVERNEKQALKWFRRAAKRGHAAAQYDLARMLHFGRGTRKNLRKAARWYEQAASRGHGRAQLGLSVLYRDGKGVDADLGRALYWAEEAVRTIEPGKQRLAVEMRDSLKQMIADRSIVEDDAPGVVFGSIF
jgi:TPR repeat protein